MAEDLADYLREMGVKVHYLHSEIETLERIEILRDLRLGVYDVVVGINLLQGGPGPAGGVAGGDPRRRQGGIPPLGGLADPGDRTGRAACRWPGDHVCRQGDRVDAAGDRRDVPPAQAQVEYNEKHGITPVGIRKAIKDISSRLRAVAEESAGLRRQPGNGEGRHRCG